MAKSIREFLRKAYGVQAVDRNASELEQLKVIHDNLLKAIAGERMIYARAQGIKRRARLTKRLGRYQLELGRVRERMEALRGSNPDPLVHADPFTDAGLSEILAVLTPAASSTPTPIPPGTSGCEGSEPQPSPPAPATEAA